MPVPLNPQHMCVVRTPVAQALPNPAQRGLPAIMISAEQGPIGTAGPVSRLTAIRRKSLVESWTLNLFAQVRSRSLFEPVSGGGKSRPHPIQKYSSSVFLPLIAFIAFSTVIFDLSRTEPTYAPSNRYAQGGRSRKYVSASKSDK